MSVNMKLQKNICKYQNHQHTYRVREAFGSANIMFTLTTFRANAKFKFRGYFQTQMETRLTNCFLHNIVFKI